MFFLAEVVSNYALFIIKALLQDWTGMNFRQIMDEVEKIKGTVSITWLHIKTAFLSLQNFYPIEKELEKVFCIYL